MRATAFLLSVLALSSFPLGCFSDGPIGMFPGGRLRGDASACPTPESGGWDQFADEIESELELRPSSPRSIRTWNLVHQGTLIIPADFLTPIKRWPHQVLEEPEVRVRIAGEIFECRATRIVDADRIEAIRENLAAKYGIEPDSRAARIEVWWFQLDPR